LYQQKIDIVELQLDRLRSESAQIESVDEFKQWTRESIRPIFPHEALGCGYGFVHAGGVGVDGIVPVDYPIDLLRDIRNKAGGIDTPILRRWMVTREPQLFEADSPWPEIPEQWLAHFRRHKMVNAAAHAIYDTERCIGTYHSFHRLPGRLGEFHIQALGRLVPIMHDVLCRLIEADNVDGPFAVRLAGLSNREREILEWIGNGKTNREIADILGLQEITVKHHVMSVFDKLGVSKRTQLVSQLVEYKIKSSKSEYGLKLL
jgi:DNA-binding CsgD family transcriptional regulator